jgi:hypothetical protein
MTEFVMLFVLPRVVGLVAAAALAVLIVWMWR